MDGQQAMSDTEYRQRFQRDAASAAQIQRFAREVLAELDAPDSEAARAAAAARLDPADLAGAEIQVVEGEQGLEPVLTTILVSLVVSAGSMIAETLWKDVIWPRVRRRLGADALGPPAPER